MGRPGHGGACGVTDNLTVQSAEATPGKESSSVVQILSDVPHAPLHPGGVLTLERTERRRLHGEGQVCPVRCRATCRSKSAATDAAARRSVRAWPRDSPKAEGHRASRAGAGTGIERT